jgi:hypothetical protein
VGSGSGNFPLAGYAAQHWMAHARIDKVSSRVKTGMQQLFDPTKPQFSAWIQLYDVDVQFWKSWYRTRGAKGLITMLQRVQNDMVKVVTGSFHTASREALLQLTWMLPMRHFVEKLTYTSALRLYRLPWASQLLQRLGPDWYVPGHGDFPSVVTRSPAVCGQQNQCPTVLEALALKVPSDGPRCYGWSAVMCDVHVMG